MRSSTALVATVEPCTRSVMPVERNPRRRERREHALLGAARHARHLGDAHLVAVERDQVGERAADLRSPTFIVACHGPRYSILRFMRLDDLAPHLGLVRDHLAELRGRHRVGFGAVARPALGHVLFVRPADDLLVELVDDRLRRARGRDDAVPGIRDHAREPVSTNVGISGATGIRLSEVTAMAFTFLPATLGNDVPTPSK